MSQVDRVEARLRRLRINLTVIFTAALAFGLVVLALIAIETDSRSRSEAREAVMSERIEASSRLIYYTNDGELRLDGLQDDDATVGSPEVRAYLSTPSGFRQVFRGQGPHLALTAESVDEVSAAALGNETSSSLTTTSRDGEEVTLLATPFYSDVTGRPAGTVLSASPTSPPDDSRRKLVLAMVIGCAGLLVLAAGTGWVLAGRSLHPAARGLTQQEELLADAAHELRNPIASIQASLEAAELDPESGERAIRTALVSARSAGQTVDTLLRRARVESGAESIRQVRLRLDQLVADVVEELPGGTRIETSGGPVVVEGDPVLIRVAVRNLLDNAIRHGHKPGEVPKVELTISQDGFAVADRGPGPPEAGDGFHRFRQGNPGGTGLGLSIAAWIAEAHGGSLSLLPREGGGTTAQLTLGPRTCGTAVPD